MKPLRALKNRKTSSYYSEDGSWTVNLERAKRFPSLADAREEGVMLCCKDCSAIYKIGDKFEAIAIVEQEQLVVGNNLPLRKRSWRRHFPMRNHAQSKIDFVIRGHVVGAIYRLTNGDVYTQTDHSSAMGPGQSVTVSPSGRKFLLKFGGAGSSVRVEKLSVPKLQLERIG